ncbi:hypothetical protein HJFPF1_07047 [Paramyrothecium foliicola]|nr:hypothetical protein HJFPF1_07047 [Paramyrothecium foliicola]
MSPPHIAPMQAVYTPVSDVHDRHDAGVSKSRKAASTGGGRAWSEDEEMYLLQTRMQKMPYKHIAAHLKKTELACRLHYHQLSHGSNRRKRTASCSSGSDGSPVIPASVPSPGRELSARSMSPPGSSGSYGVVSAAAVSHHHLAHHVAAPQANHPVHLPSILSADSSPKLPAILPKPVSMELHRGSSPHAYPTPSVERHTSLPPANFHPTPTHQQPGTPPLRLDCSALPPPSTLGHTAAHVDLNRLHHIYSSHRNSFWATIANEYGPSASPSSLEHAWKTGACCNPQRGAARSGSPITPIASPGNTNADADSYSRSSLDKTRISSILGFDTDRRSACDRDMVRRMDEQRFSVPTTA